MARRKLTDQILAEEMTSHPRWETFLAFDDDNPEVFEWLLDEARAPTAKGHRVSIAYLWERLHTAPSAPSAGR